MKKQRPFLNILVVVVDNRGEGKVDKVGMVRVPGMVRTRGTVDTEGKAS